MTDWSSALPRPIVFVLSGGASLGAIQVGMLRALADAGVTPDRVVGTSVGGLNGAVVAEHPSLADAVASLEDTWRGVHRRHVFPRNPIAQAISVLRTSHLYSQAALTRLIRRTIRARTFDQLARPLTVVTADVLTSHVHWIDSGDLVRALKAATAIPGLFPPVTIDGRVLWDAGPVANVPLQAGLARGAASLVVLDAGDSCHLDVPPRGVPDGLLMAAMIAMRQRVMVEAPAVAAQVPMLYLPRPCNKGRSPLDFRASAELIDPTDDMVTHFLRTAVPPRAGHPTGAPHHHPTDHHPRRSAQLEVGPTDG